MDQTKRPLRVPPDFATYAEEHDIFPLFEEMVKSLVIHRPSDMLQHVKEFLQLGQRKTIVVYGPPGVGKRALARTISKEFNCLEISAEDVVRDAAKQGTEAGFKAKPFVDAGNKVPEDIVTECILARLAQPDCHGKSWVLHGYPTTRSQATAMQTAGHLCSHFVDLRCPNATAAQRAASWVVDDVSGKYFNDDWRPAPEFNETTKVEYTSLDEDMRHFKNNEFHVRNSFKANARVIDATGPYDQVEEAALTFLRTKRRTNAPVIPRVIFGGPTGAGKTTVARELARIYDAVYVNAKDLITMAVSSGSKMGAALKPYVDRGMMVPDNLFTKLVVERLWEEDCVTKGWALDGFPLTRAQAQGLSKAGFVPNLVVFLDSAPQVCIDRLVYRRTDPVTGRRYHLTLNPPPSEEVLGRLRQHPEDEEEAVQRRLMDYGAFAAELRDFYSKSVSVNADQPVDDILTCVESHLVTPVEKS